LMEVSLSKLCTDGMWIDRTWIPAEHCTTLRSYTRTEAAKCLNNRHVVFGGNSVTRHLYYLFHNFLYNEVEDETQAGRIAEKIAADENNHYKDHPVDYNAAKYVDVNTLDPESEEAQCFPKATLYNKKLFLCVNFNCNHPTLLNSTWEVTEEIKRKHIHSGHHGNPDKEGFQENMVNITYAGNFSFQWLYDWYSPMLLRLLNTPNTIVIPNAGLNQRWAHDSGWEVDAPIDKVATQFPTLWNAPVHPSSMLIIRQTTKSCSYYDVFDTDLYILNYTSASPIIHHSFIPLFDLTEDRMHYIDCNHHPGPIADQTMMFLLNIMCASSTTNGELVNRQALLAPFNNSIVYVKYEEPPIKMYFWFVNNIRIALRNETSLEDTLGMPKLPIYQVSTSFLKYVEERDLKHL